tara:strand:+ start:200 stop:523 length:324 start_codon:yes stop_codon:yes gene_type:complete
MNKNKSKALGKALAKKGINIQYMLNWQSDGTINGYNDQPYLGSAMSNGERGHYFKKHGPGNWTASEKKIIREVIKSKGYKVGHISDMETEYDNDRTYLASVTFFKKY